MTFLLITPRIELYFQVTYIQIYYRFKTFLNKQKQEQAQKSMEESLLFVSFVFLRKSKDFLVLLFECLKYVGSNVL